MKTQNHLLARCTGLALGVIGFLGIFMSTVSHAEPIRNLQKKLPNKIDEWRAQLPDQVYDTISIFEYINGAGEVYKAYNMRLCLSRRYEGSSGLGIVLDIFDMGSSEDAFGVFTHDTDGEIIDIGQDARFRPGWLSFWQHRFFVSIYSEDDSTAALEAVKALGLQVAAGISKRGEKPKLVSLLPQEGLVAKNIRFLHHPIVLNYHFFIADQNILKITPQSKAVLATYNLKSQEARLLLILYPDESIAAESLTEFYKYYLPDADKTGTAQLENGKWASALMQNNLLAIVLESDSRALGESLLNRVKEALPGF